MGQQFTQTVLRSLRAWFGILSMPLRCEGLLLVLLIRTHHSFSRMAEITVEVILKRAERLKPDCTIARILVNVAQLASDGQEGVCSMHFPPRFSSTP